MSTPAYNKLLTENVTKTYKHAPDDTMHKINKELKYIASELNITNRIDPMNETPAFISLKDHKADFENNPKCRLINPAKSSLGKVSKSILDNINKIIRQKTQASQWRNSTDVISWFKSIPCKEKKILHILWHHRFLPLDLRTATRPIYLIGKAIHRYHWERHQHN